MKKGQYITLTCAKGTPGINEFPTMPHIPSNGAYAAVRMAIEDAQQALSIILGRSIKVTSATVELGEPFDPWGELRKEQPDA